MLTPHVEPILIEVRKVRGGWSAIEGIASTTIFPKKRHAQNHALAKARYRIGAVHIYDELGKLERAIPFNGKKEGVARARDARRSTIQTSLHPPNKSRRWEGNQGFASSV